MDGLCCHLSRLTVNQYVQLLVERYIANVQKRSDKIDYLRMAGIHKK